MVGILVTINCVGFKEIISVDTTEGLSVGRVEVAEIAALGATVGNAVQP